MRNKKLTDWSQLLEFCTAPDSSFGRVGERDYEGELSREVERVAEGDAVRRAALLKVADRLLDRARVRVAVEAEDALAQELLAGVDLRDAGAVTEVTLLAIVLMPSDLLVHETETDRQTDRQTDTGRQTGSQAGRQTDRQTDRPTDRQTETFSS